MKKTDSAILSRRIMLQPLDAIDLLSSFAAIRHALSSITSNRATQGFGHAPAESAEISAFISHIFPVEQVERLPSIFCEPQLQVR